MCPPTRRQRQAHTCAVPFLGIQGEAPCTGAMETAHSVAAGALRTQPREGFAFIHICSMKHKTSNCPDVLAVPNRLPASRLLPCHALSRSSRLRAQTHLYRRAGLTGSPGWQSPAPGDTGWQTPRTLAWGTPHMWPPTQLPQSNSRHPSGTCQAGQPHTHPHPSAGNKAPGARLQGGAVTCPHLCHTVPTRTGIHASLGSTHLKLPHQSEYGTGSDPHTLRFNVTQQLHFHNGINQQLYLNNGVIQKLHFFVFCLFRAAPTAYGGSQARGLIGAVAARLHHSHSLHSIMGSEPRLQPTPQLMAMPDP